MATDWSALGAAKRDSVLALIPAEWRLESVPTAEEQRDAETFVRGYLNAREVEITETDAVGIVAQTTTGKWSAEEVARAFCHRAALAHQVVHCLHEIFFDAAIAEAKRLDAYFAEHKKPIGALHGLPVSLKDQFHVKDVETSMGYIGWLGTFQGQKGTGKERVFESEMVRELRNLGAVLYVKTSVPHTLMSGETVNNIIGYTYNSKNRFLAAGGSSGGEGALIGCRGSPLGFGTDIGGSIRIPAAFNGLFGLRPSSGRLPYEGMANSMDGQNTILSVVGPLTTTAQALRLASKALLSQEPWLHDPFVNEMPWRDEIEKPILDMMSAGGKFQKLSFGIIKHDGMVTPNPPIKRALEMTVKALEKLGHEVIEWKPPTHARALEIATKVWLFDGGNDVNGSFKLSGEPAAKQISVIYGRDDLKEANATEVAAANVAKRDYQKEYMEYWNSTATQTSTGRPVDAVIAPVAPFPAPLPTTYLSYTYSMFVNTLDYSSATFPVTKVDKNVDKTYETFEPVDETDKKINDFYDPEVFDGAHVSLQVMGRRQQEEKVVALSEYIHYALQKAA